MKYFSGTGTSKTLDNSPSASRRQAKLIIRQNVLAAIGSEKASVFDAFAGEGHMHDAVWHAAKAYVGCDMRFFPDDRVAFVADNRRVLRAVDLAAYNVFDLDAYGCPWEQVYIIASRRTMLPGERIGFVLTEGQGMRMKMSNVSRALSLMAGLRPSSWKQPDVGIFRRRQTLLSKALLKAGDMLQASIVKRWQGGDNYRSSMQYMGVVYEAPVSNETIIT
jgi:hypothetical protein